MNANAKQDPAQQRISCRELMECASSQSNAESAEGGLWGLQSLGYIIAGP